MRILSAGRRYPMSMVRFFDAAMRREGHEVYTVGPYSGDGGSIPWPGQPSFPQYVDKPTIELPEHMQHFPLQALAANLPEGGVDLAISFDAGFRLTGRLGNTVTALYGTDPHALNYAPYYQEYDLFFSAQKQSLASCPGAVWIPLAFDPEVHRQDAPITAEARPTDVCFVGVMGTGPSQHENAYWQRYRAVHALAEHFSTFSQQGLIFDGCTARYNAAKIAFNWSSSWDLPMRLWEGAAYGCCVVTNRLPFLDEVGFIDGETCITYDTQEELISKVQGALTGTINGMPYWQWIAMNGNAMVNDYAYEGSLGEPQTYDTRVRHIIEVVEQHRG